MSYESLLPLMHKCKTKLSPEGFHSIINIVFHDHEALVYDKMHDDMQQSLLQQMDLLVLDVQQYSVLERQNLTLLDIGCGTGMSTETLLKTNIGNQIKHVTLLDSSPKMLEIALQKAKTWKIDHVGKNGDIAQIDNDFDIVLICSVLHQYPDLALFLKQVIPKIKPGGILIHLQDPNGDFANDQEFIARLMQFKDLQNAHKKEFKIADLIPKKVKHFINLKLGKKNYIDHINGDLLKKNAIKKRLTADEIWSVTDIHVPSKTNIFSSGISYNFLEKKLHEFKNISRRTYGFFGVLKSDNKKSVRTIHNSTRSNTTPHTVHRYSDHVMWYGHCV